MNLKKYYLQDYYDDFDYGLNTLEDTDRKEKINGDEGRRTGLKHRFQDANKKLHDFEPVQNETKVLDANVYRPFEATPTESVSWSSYAPHAITLETTYPGLISGTGYVHETGTTDEITLGPYFDHTTGLPVLPGSSVKGALRAAFPRRERKNASAEGIAASVRLLNACLKKIEVAGEWSEDELHELEEAIFNGHADVFFDAFPYRADTNGRLLGPDFITPHKGALKDPIPLRMLKVLPGVRWRFEFRLRPTTLTGGKTLTAEKKRELFRLILLVLGVGAKTNVGYGQLIDPDAPNELDGFLETTDDALPNDEPSSETTSTNDVAFVTPEKQKPNYLYPSGKTPYSRRKKFKVEGRVKASGTVNRILVFVEKDYHQEVSLRYAAGLKVGHIVTVEIMSPAKGAQIQQVTFVGYKYPQP